jgi:hypothetical protein
MGGFWLWPCFDYLFIIMGKNAAFVTSFPGFARAIRSWWSGNCLKKILAATGVGRKI